MHHIKIKNEQIKLAAAALNTVAVAFVVSALVIPVARDGNFDKLFETMTVTWGLTGIIMHGVAQNVLGRLKPETEPNA